MLVLSRGIGDSIYIDDAISLTVYDKLRFHAVLAVVSKRTLCVRFNDAPLHPAQFPGGERFYLAALLAGQTLHIDQTAVTVVFDTGKLDSDDTPLTHVRLCLDAPKGIAIHREEIHRRILRENNQPLPASPADWIERMNTPDFRYPQERGDDSRRNENP